MVDVILFKKHIAHTLKHVQHTHTHTHTNTHTHTHTHTHTVRPTRGWSGGEENIMLCERDYYILVMCG